jgi:hypothetical protein
MSASSAAAQMGLHPAATTHSRTAPRLRGAIFASTRSKTSKVSVCGERVAKHLAAPAPPDGSCLALPGARVQRALEMRSGGLSAPKRTLVAFAGRVAPIPEACASRGDVAPLDAPRACRVFAGPRAMDAVAGARDVRARFRDPRASAFVRGAILGLE